MLGVPPGPGEVPMEDPVTEVTRSSEGPGPLPGPARLTRPRRLSNVGSSGPTTVPARRPVCRLIPSSSGPSTGQNGRHGFGSPFLSCLRVCALT